MGSLRNKIKCTTPLFVLLVICVMAPATVLHAGYQEEKLFDGNFYTPDELREKISRHNREIQVIDGQIKALETDIDWLVLKINRVQDSGRSADPELKKSITVKEKLIFALMKNRDRLQDLVAYYMAQLDTDSLQGESLKGKKLSLNQKKAKIAVKNIRPKRKAPKAGSAGTAMATGSGNTTQRYPITTMGETRTISKAQLQEAINKAGLTDWVEINGSETCLRIETTLPILFATGSAKVAKEYKPFFEKLAVFLKPYDVKVLVNGYADVVPIHNKKYPSNFELGATRAANIVHQLVGFGLKPSVFKIESTGKYRFAAKGMSQQKSLERKAEVTVIFSG